MQCFPLPRKPFTESPRWIPQPSIDQMIDELNRESCAQLGARPHSTRLADLQDTVRGDWRDGLLTPEEIKGAWSSQ